MASPEYLGKYRIVSTLGTGGMGTVYVALDEVLDRRVAIKTVRTQLTDAGAAEELARRFLVEAKAAGKLSHPNIVGVYEYGTEGPVAFIVMELVDGQELKAYFDAGHRFTLAQTGRLMGQLLDALAMAHGHGVLHCDVKPANIFITAGGDLKLGDFGLAVIDASASKNSRTEPGPPDHPAGSGSAWIDDSVSGIAGTLVGTPSYMSPEQIQGHPVDARTDLFAAGVILYQFLTGTKPFAGESTLALLQNVLGAAPPAPSTLDRVLPPALDTVIAKALAKAPEDRYASAEDFRKALQLALDGRTPGAGGDAADRSEPDALPTFSATGWRSLAVLGGLGVAGILLFSARVPSHGTVQGTPSGSPLQPIVYWVLLIPAALVLAYLARVAMVRTRQRMPPAVAEPPSKQDNIPDNTLIVPRPRLDPVARPAPGPDHPFTAEEDRTQFNPRAGRTASSEGRRDATLVVLASASEVLPVGSRFALSRSPFRVGRAAGLELSIPGDPSLSREHALIEQVDGRFTLRDTGSANGVHVNGLPVPPAGARLHINDEIQLSGRTTLKLVATAFVALPDLTGKRIANRYQLIEQVHLSERAAMYRGEDEAFHRTLLIKVFSPTLAAFPDFEAEFDREAQIAANLSHPHIVKILDHGISECALEHGQQTSVLYLCMEWMAGGSLTQRLDATPAASDVVRWVRQLADALDYAHSQNIVHAGIKPSSVQFDRAGHTYLTDFAIAVRLGEVATGRVAGAPLLLAPEQWAGLIPTPATDQYALGVLTYRLLTGEWPFTGQRDRETRERNAKRGALPAHKLAQDRGRTDIPAAVSAVLARALETDPAARYGAVGTFAAALESAFAATTTKVTPRVFLSYARAQSHGWPSFIESQLETLHDIRTFLDTRKLDAVERFPDALRREIEGCDVFICLLGITTLSSAWVREEIRTASQFGKPMVPIFQESFDPSPYADDPDQAVRDLLQHQGVTLLDERQVYLKECVAELARRIKSKMGADG